MPCYAYVTRARKLPDGIWEPVWGYFRSQDAAWKTVDILFPIMKKKGDYDVVEVIRTIRFHCRKDPWVDGWEKILETDELDSDSSSSSGSD